MANLKTPIIRPLREQGGTFYTFASAIEDIGLNIAERKNTIRLSHYAILDIPNTNENDDDASVNKFNFYTCPGAMGKRIINDTGNATNKLGDQNPNESIAQSFMSYALNMETAILNNVNYDYSLALTTSERIFWKWLKESGAIRWYKDSSGNILEGDNVNDNESKYIPVVKGIGKIDGVSQRSSNYGMYNEVYVNIPASFGTSTPIMFKQIEDNNYAFGKQYITSSDKLIGQYNDVITDGLYNFGFYDYSYSFNDISTYYTLNDIKGKMWTDEYKSNLLDDNSNVYLIDNKIQDNNENDKISFKSADGYLNYAILRSKYDCMMLDILLDNEYYTTHNKDYDSLSTDINSKNYQFNTILIYYSIYDNNNSILATNLYGVYFIDKPIKLNYDDTMFNFKLPRLDKVKSNKDGFGTSYSFRLNMRTSSIYDTTNDIIDNSSSENSIVNDFNNVVSNLNKSIELLGKNTKHTHTLTEKYNEVYKNIISITNKLNELDNNVNNLLNTNANNLNANSIKTNEIVLLDNPLNIKNDNTKIDIININSENVLEYNANENEINVIPSMQISNLSKQLNINNTLNDDDKLNMILNDIDIFKYIKIVPKSSQNNNTYDLLDLEIKNDINIDDINFAIKNKKLDIITLLAYILHKIK